MQVLKNEIKEKIDNAALAAFVLFLANDRIPGLSRVQLPRLPSGSAPEPTQLPFLPTRRRSPCDAVR